MLTLSQHLSDLPFVVVQAIAQKQGLLVESSRKADYVNAIVKAAEDTEHRTWVWNMFSAEARTALMRLASAQNKIPIASFQRQFGEIRRLGPGRLEKEQPWRHPATAAEELWYAGFLARAFVESEEGVVEVCSIPTDLLPLPAPPPPPDRFQFAQMPAPAPTPAAVRDAGDMLLDDLATLLIYVREHRVWLSKTGHWRAKDLEALRPQWRHQPGGAADSYIDLLLHCARAQKLTQTARRQEQLQRERLQVWLQGSRAQQAFATYCAWRDSPHWDDLCRTPGLHCEEGNWRHDPLFTRQAILDILQEERPWQWRRLDDFIEAIHTQMPDFQRPDGNYHTWYIRDEEGKYLKGFERWEQVEGRVLAYLWKQPLFYFGLIAWDKEMTLWALTDRGTAYVRNQPLPTLQEPSPLQVTNDFRVILPEGTPLIERFRVTRFCLWEASTPQYRYRITQSSLRRAARQGIRPSQVVHYLIRTSQEQVPERVVEALTKFRP